MIQFLTRLGLDHVLPIDNMCIEHLCIYTYENWIVTRIERVKAPQMCHLRRSRRRIAAGEVMGGLVWERPRIGVVPRREAPSTSRAAQIFDFF